jgi:hypothetical protein
MKANNANICVWYPAFLQAKIKEKKRERMKLRIEKHARHPFLLGQIFLLDLFGVRVRKIEESLHAW